LYSYDVSTLFTGMHGSCQLDFQFENQFQKKGDALYFSSFLIVFWESDSNTALMADEVIIT